MSRKSAGLSIGLIVGALLSAVLLMQSSPTPAQTPAQAPAQPPTVTSPSPADAGYVGSETCKGCHEDQWNKFAPTKMGRLMLQHPRSAKEGMGCEGCHGPGKEHVEKGGGKGVGGMITFAKNDKTPVDKRNQVCTTCHNKGPHLFWKGSAHESRDVACTSCHVVMESRTAKHQLARESVIDTCGQCHVKQKGQQLRSSHMPLREGKMSCTSCHNPHGTISPALLKEPSPNATCFTCHTDKRGPFLWVHAPVNESCSNCHDPHGSNHERMLKVAKPRLCQQCHVESRHPTSPYGRDGSSLKFVMGRSCANCHVNIHGSNHPSGFAFTR
jgi:DmsE family decaheme c-type cytochrome